MVGDNSDLIVQLLHKTKDMELNTAQMFFRTKKRHWDITSIFLLPACVRNKPFMRHILSFYSVSGYNTTRHRILEVSYSV